MQALADAVVYAVTYINLPRGDDEEEDDDCGALESIADLLRNGATDLEQDALAAAAKRALCAERESPSPRPEFIASYSNWMEEMFGDGWEGNDRV
jgi:hypothetical protein